MLDDPTHRSDRLVVLLLALPARGQDAPRAQDAPCERDRVRGRVGEERARRHHRGLWPQQRPQGGGEHAASSALAKQIEEGAPADVFISADQDWMDYAAQKKLIVPKSRVQSARQPAGAGGAEGYQARRDQDRAGLRYRAKLAGDGRIAVGDVRAVPAGKYAKSGAGEARRLEGGRAEACAGRERARRADAGRPAAARRSASSTRPMRRSSRA